MQLIQHELEWVVILVGRLKPALRRLEPDRASIHLKM